MIAIDEFKSLRGQIRAEEQARKLELARILRQSAAGSEINPAAWRSWHEYEFFVFPRRRTTCDKLEAVDRLQLKARTCSPVPLLMPSRKNSSGAYPPSRRNSSPIPMRSRRAALAAQLVSMISMRRM
jgi:hypothetical protein